MNNKYQIIRLLFSLLILSACAFIPACTNDTQHSSVTGSYAADTITVRFQNASLPPENQFYATLKMANGTYTSITEYNDSNKKTTVKKGVLNNNFWNEIHSFQPEKLNSQNEMDGESLCIEYHCNDSIYVHYATTIGQREQQLLNLMDIQ